MPLSFDLAANGTVFVGDRRVGRVVLSSPAASSAARRAALASDKPFRGRAEDGRETAGCASREEAAAALVLLVEAPT